MDPISVLTLRQNWEILKAAKIADIENVIKGKCILRDRHWLKLISLWEEKFFKEHKINIHSPIFRVEWCYSGYLVRNNERK